MKIERVWAMPNKNTFDIAPIRNLLSIEVGKGLWIDPFANKNKWAKVTNDLNPDFDTDYHLDALEFLRLFDDESVDGVLYDPPYSPRQVSECYNNIGLNVTWDTTKASFWGNHKREISRIIKVGGKVITFGWNSGGIGKTNGFEITRILLVPHGGWHNDTICTVEVKCTYSSARQNTTADKLENFTEKEKTKMPEMSITDELLINKIQTLPQDFWDFKGEDTKEMSHGIHTYPAIMVYPISRKIIDIIKNYQPINSILDPFMGSGTVLVEGIVAGFDQIYGTDLNPLAQLISEVKTTNLVPDEMNLAVKKLINDIDEKYTSAKDILEGIESFINEQSLDITAKDGWGSDAPAYIDKYLQENGYTFEFPRFKNIGYWFKPYVIFELQLIKNAIELVENNEIRNFFKITLSETIRFVSNRRNGEFKMFRMPVDKIKKHNPVVKAEFEKILKRNVEKMHDFYLFCDNKKLKPEVSIFAEDTRILSNIPDNSIDLMITSPPYGDSRTTVAYGEFSRLSLQWLDLFEKNADEATKLDKQLMGGQKYRNGFEYTLNSETLRRSLEKIKESDIERAGDVYSFYKDLDDCIRTISKKMKLNTYQFWVVGNRTVKLETLLTDKIISELGEQYGLRHVYTIPRNIPNKVMPSLNSPTNIAGDKVSTMTNEHIVILRKLV